MAKIYVEFESQVGHVFKGSDINEALSEAVRCADDHEDRINYYTEFLDEQEEEAEDSFTVYIESESGLASYPFMTFDTEKEAHDFCEENDWVWLDEYEYEWKLVYYHD